MRKRAFLALLSLDRFVSSFLGRPLAIADADVDVQAPMEITDEELLEWERQARAAKVKGLPIPPPPSLAAADPSVALPPTTFNRWKVGTVLHEIMGSALLQLYGLRREKAPEKVVQIVCELDSRLNAWLELVPSPLSWCALSLPRSSLPSHCLPASLLAGTRRKWETRSFSPRRGS
jgi:hypothetical protein